MFIFNLMKRQFSLEYELFTLLCEYIYIYSNKWSILVSIVPFKFLVTHIYIFELVIWAYLLTLLKIKSPTQFFQTTHTSPKFTPPFYLYCPKLKLIYNHPPLNPLKKYREMWDNTQKLHGLESFSEWRRRFDSLKHIFSPMNVNNKINWWQFGCLFISILFIFIIFWQIRKLWTLVKAH